MVANDAAVADLGGVLWVLQHPKKAESMVPFCVFCKPGLEVSTLEIKTAVSCHT